MKIGISVGGGFDRWGENKYIHLKEHGFDCVDIDLANTATPFYTATEADAIRLLKDENAHITQAGLCVSQIHGPWRWPPQDNTVADLLERSEKMRRSLRLTAAIGCPYWVVHPVMPLGTGELGTPNADKTWDINLAFFAPLAAEAVALGVTICLENMPMPQFSLGTPQETLRLARTLGVGFCLDTGHVSVYGGKLSLAQAVRDAGDTLKVMHLHDNDGARDYHRFPFMGSSDWLGFAAALKEIGFDGVLSAECAPPSVLPDDVYDTFCRGLAQMLSFLKSLATE